MHMVIGRTFQIDGLVMLVSDVGGVDGCSEKSKKSRFVIVKKGKLLGTSLVLIMFIMRMFDD